MGFTTGLRALGISALAAVSIAAVAAPIAAAADPSTSPTTTTTTSVPAVTTSAPAVTTAAVVVKATVTTSAARRVVAIAEAQRGKRYAFGASGPRAFDCSGLVRYAYAKAGVSGRLGGGHSGYGMLAWARSHHAISHSNPQVGDVVIYGNGYHAAIYIGGGRVVSALNPRQGIRVTALHALRQSVTGYIHTHLGSTPMAAAARTASQPTAHAAPARASHAVRANAFVNLRTGASRSSRVLTVVRPGTTLGLLGSVLNHGARWDHVTYRGHAAWVLASLVRAA